MKALVVLLAVFTVAVVVARVVALGADALPALFLGAGAVGCGWVARRNDRNEYRQWKETR